MARFNIFGVLVVALLVTACGDGGGTDDATANADAMAREHANDTTAGSPIIDGAPRVPVISETLPYAETEDDLVYGYFVVPEDMFEPLPAVIMIHEWWGLNDNIRAMAERLAGEGYIVLAVDLYGGQTADSPAAARELMLRVANDEEAARDNLRAAYNFLANTAAAPRIASLGWCFGGAWSLRTALLFPDELDAAVVFYGQVTNDEEVLRPLNVPLLGLFAEDDRGIKVDSVIAFREALERLRKDYIVHVYPDVGHAFANPTGQRFNRAAADDAWRRTLRFLDLHLAVDE